MNSATLPRPTVQEQIHFNPTDLADAVPITAVYDGVERTARGGWPVYSVRTPAGEPVRIIRRSGRWFEYKGRIDS